MIFINLSVQEIQGRGILGYAEELRQGLELPTESIIFEIQGTMLLAICVGF